MSINMTKKKINNSSRKFTNMSHFFALYDYLIENAEQKDYFLNIISQVYSGLNITQVNFRRTVNNQKTESNGSWISFNQYLNFHTESSITTYEFTIYVNDQPLVITNLTNLELIFNLMIQN